VSPTRPEHYGYDFVNADIVLNLLSVKDGWLTTPSGMRYRALQLGGSSSRMTLPVLRKIAALVDAGAVVVGARPTGITEPVGRSAGVRADCRSQSGRSGKVTAQPIEEGARSAGLGPDFEVVARRTRPSWCCTATWLTARCTSSATAGPAVQRGRSRFASTGREAESWDA
jgi:hypothetical protein